MNGGAPSPQAYAEAARAALRRWDLSAAELALFAHRENAVFKVHTRDASFALRVHRPGYHDDAALASELAWMRALSEAGVEVPAIVPASDGKLFVKVRSGGIADPVQVDLFEWIDGERFWELPSLDREQRSLLIETRDRLFGELAALPKTPDAYGLIHADLLPENVLVCGDRLRVIDFDDCGYGWHLFEIVTALYAVEGEPWYADARDAFLASYREHRPLDEAALARLPLFFLARALTDVGWMHTRAETENARRSTAARVTSACALAEAWLRS